MSISALSKQCSELFHRCLASSASNHEELAVTENQIFRFNLWVQNNAAISEKRDSMDWRLRKASVPHSVMRDLLEDLAESIKRSFLSVESSRQPGLGDDTLDSIDGILDELFRFSRAIRRSGAMRRFVKVANYFEYDEETGENLTIKFQDTILPYLNATLKQTSEGLRQRLHETICLRHQNFSFLKSRSGRKVVTRLVKEPELESTPSGPQASSRLGSTYSVRTRQTSQKVSQSGQVRRNRPRTAPSFRSATTVNTNQLPLVEPIPEREAVEYTGVDLPRRPKVTPGMTELECPYCFLVYPAKEFTKENWPRHIVRDLMPFICVLEPCPTPNAMFDSHGAWISHMEKEHAREGWTCMDSNHSPTQYFEHEQLFRRHMIEKHDNDFTIDELDDIVDELFGPLPAFQLLETCPFCEHYDPEDESADIDQHIALHLLFLSQVSLPGDFLETKDAEFESESEKSSSSNRLEGSRRSPEILSLSTVSSFRTVKTGSTGASVSNTKLLENVEDAIRRLILPELEQLKKEQRKRGPVGEPSGNDFSLDTPTATSPAPVSPDTADLEPADDTIEPPLITHQPGEPDIWDELQVRRAEKLRRVEHSYDPEMDVVLFNFRLRYIHYLEGYNDLKVGGEEVIESSMRLARALDTRGRYSDAEAILKKLMSNIEAEENAHCAEFAQDAVRDMLESCPSDRYREPKKMLAGFVPPLLGSGSFASTSRHPARPTGPAGSTSGSELGHQVEAKGKGKAAPEYVGGDVGAPVLEIELGEEEDEGRWKSLPPHHLTYTINKTHHGVRLRCRTQDVVHGYLADGQDLASLLVYEFDFLSHREPGRIKDVNIQFVYHGHNRGPEVLNIAPGGRRMLAITRQTGSIEMDHYTIAAGTVMASIDLVDRDYGEFNAASWELREDPESKLGVPRNFQFAVLLRRADMDEFTGTLRVNATAVPGSTFRRALERLSGSSKNTSIGDILYNPSMAATNNLRVYDTENLSAVDIEELMSTRNQAWWK
ncbi:hypothetical protein BGZ61DRAFT_590926 [Ilyonectria robusta]|uniref:uncharacterized protein n=1 Tax=Ilyonectria robusta TaxID=1079257 RepID=UPI001E8ED6B0|nr:uncharacterized protein BGZ61DRAFT_590926 [Ilyonectria robusta]KAH8679418.1 hypothetical protein BGZ61DRAFT_590926 [Ilyonectria robusta]